MNLRQWIGLHKTTEKPEAFNELQGKIKGRRNQRLMAVLSQAGFVLSLEIGLLLTPLLGSRPEKGKEEGCMNGKQR